MEWIKVETNIPEMSEIVLAYSDEYQSMHMSLFDGDNFLTYNNDEDGWCRSEWGDDVTHWMPLPAPPQD